MKHLETTENTTVTAPQYTAEQKRQTYRRTNHVEKTEQYLFDWMGQNLRSNRETFVMDIDKVIRSVKNCTIIIEVKRMNKQLIEGSCQANTLNLFDAIFKEKHNKMVTVKGMRYPVRFKYYGLHTLVFEKTTFENGAVFWDGKEVTEQELINILSFNNDECCF